MLCRVGDCRGQALFQLFYSVRLLGIGHVEIVGDRPLFWTVGDRLLFSFLDMSDCRGQAPFLPASALGSAMDSGGRYNVQYSLDSAINSDGT